jgi:hypothetical protein
MFLALMLACSLGTLVARNVMAQANTLLRFRYAR